MRTGKINQSTSGLLNAGTWQLVAEKEIAVNEGTDSFDKLLIHFNGSDGSTDDYTAETGQTVSLEGTAQLDTAQKEFGTASLLLDGNSDYVTVPDSADWNFGTGNFTIDFRIRFASLTMPDSYFYVMGQRADDNNRWLIFVNTSNQFYLYFNIGGVVKGYYKFDAVSLSINTWYHLAFERDGTTARMFFNGVPVDIATTSTAFGTNDVGDVGSVLYIGQVGSVGYVNGWIDEVRICKGIARWTTNFTPPTAEYGITSHTFSNLNGDVDQEYRLITRIVNGYNGIGYYHMRTNNDSSANIYGLQYLRAIDTTVAANRSTADYILLPSATALGSVSLSDINIYAKSGFVRTIIAKETYGIEGTTVYATRLVGHAWNNTADNITSLVITASQANGLGVGTHLFLFKRNLLGTVATSGIKTGILNVQGAVNCGIMQKIYQTTLTEAATSVTISNLDGDTDTIYELRIRVINGNAGDTIYTLTMNTDTGANYGYQYIRGINAAVSAGRNSASGMVTNAIDGGTTGRSFSKTLLYVKSGYIRTGISEYIDTVSGTTVTVLGLKGLVWNNTADNITSIVLTANQISGLGAGTVIELWALRKKI